MAVPLLLFGGEVQAKSPAQWDAKVQVEQLKAPVKDAIGPKVGDMVAIRFVGSYQGKVFDDTMSADLPYFYRAGAGLIVKGLDDAVVHMKLGEKLAATWRLRRGGRAQPARRGSPPALPSTMRWSWSTCLARRTRIR